MSGNGVAALISGSDRGGELTVDAGELPPGRYEVSLRAVTGPGNPMKVRARLGDESLTLTGGSSRAEEVATLRGTLDLTAPTRKVSLAVEDFGLSWSIALDTLTLRKVDAAARINRVWLMPWPDGGLPGELDVETSLDGSEWQTVARRTGLQQVRQSPVAIAFPDVDAEHVRITGRQLAAPDSAEGGNAGPRQWMGFVAARVSLGRESPWARTAPSVEVSPTLSAADDGSVAVILTNTTSVEFGVDTNLLVGDRFVPGVRVPVMTLDTTLPPREPKVVTLHVPDTRLRDGPVDVEVWVDRDGSTVQGRQVRSTRVVPRVTKVDLPCLAQAVWNSSLDPNPAGWVTYDQPWFSRGSASLVVQTGQTLTCPVALQPGTYTAGLWVYDYGDGRPRSVTLTLGDQSQELTWGSSVAGMTRVEAPFTIDKAVASFMLRSEDVPGAAIVDFVTFRPAAPKLER